MTTGRLEAFSDGVFAIIITIMVLEIKRPEGDTIIALQALLPVLFSYTISFVFIGIYWNSHHHLLHLAESVNGRILWANLHLLFWLSLVPFVTGWMGENRFTALPVALYGTVLFVSGLAYYILARQLVEHHGSDSPIAQAIGADRKGLASLVIYSAAIGIAFFSPWVSCGLYVVVALIWFIPDQRIEQFVSRGK